MRILVAEDDITSRNILAAILRKWDYQPVLAENGNEAWDVLIQPDAPSLVLLDWDMPGMDGLEICRRLRERGASNPPYIILLTGRQEKGDIVVGLDAGANDYIAKPYDIGELQARIRVGCRMLELQSSLIQARDALEHLAMHDSLTGILNRRAILERLKIELSRAKRENTALSVGLCDIDHFKDINDAHGHQAGDAVIIAFATCVTSHLRDYDSMGRYGGEEFLVIAPIAEGRSRIDLYERLRAEFAKTEVQTKAGGVSATVSIGVVSAPGDMDIDTVLARADAALYQAKAGGRNRVVYSGV